ncbi:MAG: universal stress protein [Candidatus Dormibacteria bacterium]|jgi:nucleotide-binding universal stress UspA family protein
MPGFTPHRILVPVNGAATDEEAVRFACRMALRPRATVLAITVVEIPRGLALSTVEDADVAAAELLLTSAEEIGRDYEVEVKGEVLQAREAGPALVDEITAREIDLAVVGLPYRERFGEFYMGRTVPHILQHAPCRVFLLRLAAPH